MEMGLRVGLGTDVAGGPQVSMLSAVRGCVLAERSTDFVEIDRIGQGWPENDDCTVVDFTYGYYLATVQPRIPQFYTGLCFICVLWLLGALMVGWFSDGVGIGRCSWEIRSWL